MKISDSGWPIYSYEKEELKEALARIRKICPEEADELDNLQQQLNLWGLYFDDSKLFFTAHDELMIQIVRYSHDIEKVKRPKTDKRRENPTNPSRLSVNTIKREQKGAMHHESAR